MTHLLPLSDSALNGWKVGQKAQYYVPNMISVFQKTIEGLKPKTLKFLGTENTFKPKYN